MSTPESPHLARITTYPVKSLDGLDRDRTGFRGQALAHDREYALVDDDGDYVNGKRERAVHGLRSEFDPDRRRLRLWTSEHEPRTFSLSGAGGDGADSGPEVVDGHGAGDETDGDALEEWLSDYFGYPVSLRRDATGGFPDDTAAAGPTVISTATIETVASWFPSISAGEMRRRLRANLEIGGVPAFWEDRLFDDRDHVVRFSIGDVTFEGVNPCQRCVVPTRDPDTGEETPGFRERFVERRRETMPSWSGGDWFDHHFRLMVNTRVVGDTQGRGVAVGDPVRVGDTRPSGD
ncbi:MOSC domain-containing protein [Salinigranum salinum]|uniref:MOSC domain-containing protein n=1 Tax=Salinigranum salinum TaxID=1364937 RepID=UPI001260FA6F|nr:MOSC N-terminal beta barrel domain-containing protein [Salinigranum salinum]